MFFMGGSIFSFLILNLINMISKLSLIFLSFIFSLSYSTQAQDTILVKLDTKVYNKSYNQEMLDALRSANLPVDNKGMLAGDYKDEQIAFRIAINNTDSKQVKIGEDGILIGAYKSDSIYLNTTPMEQNMLIGNEDKYFRLVEVDPEGKFLKFVPFIENTNDSVRFTLFDRLPKQDFKSLNGEDISLRDYLGQGKYIYLEIWGLWCSPCLQATDSLKKIFEEYNHNLTIISLNYKDTDYEAVNNYIESKEMYWINGFTNEKINKAINLNGIPYGILFSPDGKLIEEKLHPFKLDRYLKENIFKE